MVLICGLVAGLLQIIGYALYIRGSLKHEIDPNAATWFMFAYGTGLLTFLEYIQGATTILLLLPGICAVLGIVVAVLCWRRGSLRWPKEWEDQTAFIVDVVLTIGYVIAWCLFRLDALDEESRNLASLVFLFCSNLTAISSFSPLIRGVKENAKKERVAPWAVWACAYTLLGVATVLQEGLFSELMLYPVLNAYLHGRVAWLSRR